MRVGILTATATASAIAISGLCLTTSPSFAASKKAKERPDFTGVWVDAHGILAADAPPFNPFVVNPPSGREPPLKPQFQMPAGGSRGGPGAADKAIAEGIEKGVPVVDPGVTRACQGGGLSGAMPTFMTPPYALEIVQNPNVTVIVNEMVTRIRHIYTDGRKHPGPDDLVITPMGESIGYWEGDTLVVETIGVTPRIGARPISDKMRITERFYLKDENLHVDMTMEDPVYLTGPWELKLEFERSPAPLVQYDCAENPRNTVDAKIAPAGTSLEEVGSVGGQQPAGGDGGGGG